ncbi:MAG: PhzF family phenazine biosynthesis protein [Candidatus Bathyarchaeia archaeon]
MYDGEKGRVRMRGLTYYLVDVFAQERYAGNQLAVVTGAFFLPDERMQAIANEMHFSETTFIPSSEKRNGGFDVRIFTPSIEVPFAGHPTLGTAYVIKHFVQEDDGGDTVVLNLKAGQIPVRFERHGAEEVLWMKQLPPTFGRAFAVEELANVLQLNTADFDDAFPIQLVSTGLPFIIVLLKTLDAVKRAKVNLDQLLKLQVEAGVLVFCRETVERGNDLHVRVFVPLFGTVEDPATGSGNGCLAGYLSRYRYFGADKIDAKVEQGYEIRRPSLLLLKAENAGSKIEVGGKVFLVAEGKLV